MTSFDLEAAATHILAHLHQTHPYKPGHVLHADELSADPRVLSPLFRGSFDWHSSVHSHWALLRLLADGHLSGELEQECRQALETSFTPDRIGGELEQLTRPHRRGFELPYGIAWLLTLGAELPTFDATYGTTYTARCQLLITHARTRFLEWLTGLPCPIRNGQHSQSAFSMSLARDAATALGDHELARLVDSKATQFYRSDIDAPITWEPSAYDFLSPALAEADLMRRVLTEDFAPWLDAFLPSFDLEPLDCADQSDGKLAHADGLNLSRAWMLSNLAPLRPAFEDSAEAHRLAGIQGLRTASYAGTHWLPSFVVYASGQLAVRASV